MNSKTMFFFICLFLLFPPAGLPQATATAMAAAVGITLGHDGRWRDEVLKALHDAMKKANESDAAILTQKAALDAAVAAGEGVLNIDPDNGAFIYTVNQIQEQIQMPLSPEELGWIQKCLLFFSDLKNSYLLTIIYLQGLSRWEQFNAFSSAVITAVGMAGFTGQCYNAASKIINCGQNIFDNMKTNTYNSLNKISNIFAGRTPVPAVPANDLTRSTISNMLEQIITEIEDKNKGINPNSKRTVNDLLPKSFTLINPIDQSEETIRVINAAKNSWSYSSAERLQKMTANRVNKGNDFKILHQKTQREEALSKKRINFPQLKTDTSTGGRTKRRSYKSKRRKSSKINSKRRRHKTKKRAYRSTRFASHK